MALTAVFDWFCPPGHLCRKRENGTDEAVLISNDVSVLADSDPQSQRQIDSSVTLLSSLAISTAEELRTSFSTSTGSNKSPTSTDSPFRAPLDIQARESDEQGNAREPHITFHPETKGENIRIEAKGNAQSVNSLKSSICFSREPVSIGEKVQLEITKSKAFRGSLRVGFTSKNPSTIAVAELPSHSYPALARQPGFWIKPVPTRLACQGNVVSYSVNSSGNVHFSINGESKGLFFNGVDVSSKLWAMMDIYGSTMAVQIVDGQTLSNDVGRSINKGDLVKVHVEDMNTLRVLQVHVMWSEDMEQVIGKVGMVKEIDDDEDVLVHFSTINKTWWFSPAALEKVGRVDPNPQAVQEVRTPAGTCKPRHHKWKTGASVCKVCVECHQCTAKGAECALRDQPLRPPGSPCGCDHGDAGCADCGICRSCDVDDRRSSSSSSGGEDSSDPIPIGEVAKLMGGEGGKKLIEDMMHHSMVEVSRFMQLSGAEVLRPMIENYAAATVAVFADTQSGNREKEGKIVEQGIKKGDQVKITDGETFRSLQEKSGSSWNEEMLKVIGIPGTVSDLNGEKILVQFANGASWELAPECLTKVSSGQQEGRKTIKKKDLVKLIQDEEKLKELQEDHAGYVVDMQAYLGKTGCVMKTRPLTVKVDFAGASWWFNRAALTRTLSENEQKITHLLKEGDYVKVNTSQETFKSNQLGHGGFVDKMKELIEEVGIVHHIDIDGDAVVYYPNGSRWCINPMTLTKVDPDEYRDVDISGVLEIGDWVKVEADKDKIKCIQESSVTWNEGFYRAAGKVGRVNQLNPFNDFARVRIKNKVYPLDLTLLKKATPSDFMEAFGSEEIKSPDFARGDLVKIDVTLDRLKSLQEGHGGYKDPMQEHIGLIGCVSFIDNDGDIHVRFTTNRFVFNAAVLTKVKPTEDTFHIGDIVLIESDKSRFVTLQTPEEHGRYIKEMETTCGMTGRLLGVITTKKVQVKVQGTIWVFNPDLVTRKGNPGLGTGDWKSATICAPGKHDWSKGKCLVCVSCGECTHFGKVCPSRGRPDRYPGSFCGCDNGDAGCNDCGCCRKCAEWEEEEELSDDKLSLDTVLGTSSMFREAMIEALKENESAMKVLASHGNTEAEDIVKKRNEHFHAALENMRQTIDLIRESKGVDTIGAVKDALEKNLLDPYTTYNRRVERKLMGDHLANNEAADVFMHFLTLLSSDLEATNLGDENTCRSTCLELVHNLLIHYTGASSEFCCALCRSGLINWIIRNVVHRQDAGTLENNESPSDHTRSMMTILYNCARVADNKEYLRAAGAVDLLKTYLKDEDMGIRFTALCGLTYIVDADELHLLKLKPTVADHLMSLLKAAIDDPQHSTTLTNTTYQYSASEIVTALGTLARNDRNKDAFIKKGAKDVLIPLLKSGDEEEKECVIYCFQQFMTQDPNQGPSVFSEVDYSDLCPLTKEQQVGQGGFGKVFKVKHKVWMIPVAVKQLALRLSDDDSLKKQLLDEASFMHQARHVRIVPLYGVCFEQEFTALVMDYMVNGSVDALMTKVPDVPWALRWRILHEAALGMTFLHSLDPRIIHHDLKAQNILLDEDFHAKITDFGLSEWKQRECSQQTADDDDITSGLSGTMTHIPPEHFLDRSLKAETEFDVYSYGVVIWEVLTGQAPYTHAHNTAHIRSSVIDGQRPDKNIIPRDGPPELPFFVDLMEECWCQEPSSRPQFRVIAERMEEVVQQTKTKVVEAVHMVLNALGRGAEKDTLHHSGKWAASMRRNPGSSGEQPAQMENTGKQGIIQSVKKN